MKKLEEIRREKRGYEDGGANNTTMQGSEDDRARRGQKADLQILKGLQISE